MDKGRAKLAMSGPSVLWGAYLLVCRRLKRGYAGAERDFCQTESEGLFGWRPYIDGVSLRDATTRRHQRGSSPPTRSQFGEHVVGRGLSNHAVLRGGSPDV